MYILYDKHNITKMSVNVNFKILLIIQLYIFRVCLLQSYQPGLRTSELQKSLGLKSFSGHTLVLITSTIIPNQKGVLLSLALKQVDWATF